MYTIRAKARIHKVYQKDTHIASAASHQNPKEIPSAEENCELNENLTESGVVSEMLVRFLNFFDSSHFG